MSEYSLEDKYDLIKKAVGKCGCEKNPVAIALKIMQNDFVNIHGPEHHFLDGAAFFNRVQKCGRLNRSRTLFGRACKTRG